MVRCIRLLTGCIGSLPSSIGLLIQLSYLRITDMPLLVGTIPTTISAATQLTELLLFSNKLIGISCIVC